MASKATRCRLPTPVARANAVRAYNEGVALLVARKFPEAQSRFEAALMLDDQLAEAHNNLAYALRMQGRQNFAASLAHYNRAIELKPRSCPGLHVPRRAVPATG